jgi:hypothetical protein
MQKLCFNNEYTILYVIYILLVFGVSVPDWKIGKEFCTILLELKLDYISLSMYFPVSSFPSVFSLWLLLEITFY